jgi:GAF domain-containing protein
MIGLVHTLAGNPAPRRVLAWTGAATMILVGAVWGTGLIATGDTYIRSDRLWGSYLAVAPGRYQWLMVPYILGVFVYGLSVVWRARGLGRWERPLFLAAFALYTALGVHDVLHAAQVIQTARIFDFAFVGVAVGLTYYQVRRHNEMFGHLEEEVGARTAELRGRHDQLAELARALTDITQGLTSTLAFEQVLQRFVGHAVALFGGDGVARLWLVEENGNWLAQRAAAGTVSDVQGLTRLRVGEGIMGQLVATRTPVTISDVREDPRMRNIERIRAERAISFAGVPLLIGERVLGGLGIGLRERRHFTEEDVQVLQLLAGHAAVAIENARLFEAAHEQARELTALHEVRTALTSTLELSAVLEAIGEWAVRLTGADGAAVFELDTATQSLSPRTSRILGPTPWFRGNVSLKIGQGAVGAAVLRREPYWSADVLAQPLPRWDEPAVGGDRPLGELAADQPFRAILAVPVVSHQTSLGAICLYWNTVHEPTTREIRFLTAFAQQAAVALENARLYQTLEERLARQQSLTRLTRLISGSLDTPTVLAEISRAAARIMSSPLALFWVADRERLTLQFSESSDPALAADFPLRQVRTDEGIVGWIATHRQAIAVADVTGDGRFQAHEWWKRHGLKSFYGMPVMFEGTLLAVLTFNSRQPFKIGAADQDLLDSFVAQAALALHNAALFEAEAAARRDVERALAQVKQLHGMLPICAYCKKIRNDRNYWETIESYIGERSAATFSHGICPDCRDRVVGPELERWKREQDL